MFNRLLLSSLAGCAFSAALHAQAATFRIASRDGWIQVEDSVRLYYRTMGSGPDTLVVVHGGPGFHMNYLVPEFTPLAAHHTLLFFDQRNAGRSTLLADTSRVNARFLVSDLEALRRHFRLERLSLLGHSWGGLLVGLYAAAHPERVGRMILVASSRPPASTVPMADPMSRLDSVTNAIRIRNLNVFRGGGGDTIKGCWDYYALWARAWFIAPVHSRRTWGDICNAPPFAMLNPTRSYPAQSVPRQDISSALAKVRGPALLIHGANDPIPFASAEAWHGLLPNATLLRFPNAGHLPWIEMPQPFFAAVDRFLSGKTVDSTVLDARGVAQTKPSDARGSEFLRARAAVAQVENEIVAAMNRGDFDSVSRAYVPDAVVFAPGGPPVIGRPAIASFWRTAARRGMKSIELTLMDLEGSGSQLNAVGKYAIRDGQGEILDVGKFIAVYRRENGRWRVVRDVFNSNLETRSPLEIPDYPVPPRD